MKIPLSPVRSASALSLEFLRFAGRRAIWAGLLVAVGALLEGAGVLLLVPMLSVLMAQSEAIPIGGVQKATSWAFAAVDATTPIAQLATLLVGLALVMLARALVIWLRDTTLSRLQSGFVFSLRARIAGKLARAPWEQVVQLRHARITHMFGEDFQRLGGCATFLIQSVVGIVTLLGQAVIALLLAPVPAMVALVMLGLAALTMRRLLRSAHATGGAVNRGNFALMDRTVQFLGGLKMAVTQNLQGRFITEFEELMRQVNNEQIAFARQQTRARLTLANVSAAVGAAVLLLGFGVLDAPGPVMVALLLVITRMSGPTGQIQQAGQMLAFSLPAYERMRALEDDIGDAVAPTDAGLAAPAFDGAIVLDGVRFAYRARGGTERGEAGGVDHVDLRIEPGELLALTGPSGAGKTTLADLIAGLITPQEGAIRIGGTTLDSTTAPAWRNRVGYVGQDSFLIHASIRDNLRWGAPECDEATLWRALTVAGATDLVRGLEHGLDTVVGERGSLLSGGERQRIALTRALLRGARLLILDEATNAIDPASERALLLRLKVLPDRPAILLIAHRTDNLDLCDAVRILAAGRIVGASGKEAHG
jgi:ATP-binding cassette subfamily C protein